MVKAVERDGEQWVRLSDHETTVAALSDAIGLAEFLVSFAPGVGKERYLAEVAELRRLRNAS